MESLLRGAVRSIQICVSQVVHTQLEDESFTDGNLEVFTGRMEFVLQFTQFLLGQSYRFFLGVFVLLGGRPKSGSRAGGGRHIGIQAFEVLVGDHACRAG